MRKPVIAERLTVVILELSPAEASYLRKMARFCVDRQMGGYDAAASLHAALAAAGVPVFEVAQPVAGLFTTESAE